jgi:hypothetical protein
MDDKDLREFTEHAKDRFLALLEEASAAQGKKGDEPRIVITPDMMNAMKASHALVEALASMTYAERNQPGRHGSALRSLGATLPNALNRAGTPMEIARKVANAYMAFLEEECRGKTPQ